MLCFLEKNDYYYYDGGGHFLWNKWLNKYLFFCFVFNLHAILHTRITNKMVKFLLNIFKSIEKKLTINFGSNFSQ